MILNAAPSNFSEYDMLNIFRYTTGVTVMDQLLCIICVVYYEA